MSITNQLLEIHRFNKSDDLARMKYIRQVVTDCSKTRNFILGCYDDLSADEACRLVWGIVKTMSDDQLYKLKFSADVFFSVMEKAMEADDFEKMIAILANNHLIDRFFIKFRNYLINEDYPRGIRIYEQIIDVIDKCTY